MDDLELATGLACHVGRRGAGVDRSAGGAQLSLLLRRRCRRARSAYLAVEHDGKRPDRASRLPRRPSRRRILGCGGERAAAALRHRAHDLADRNQRGNRLPPRARSRGVTRRPQPRDAGNVGSKWALSARTRSFVLEALQHRALGALPSPLWGGVGGGGSAILSQVAPPYLAASPPSPTLPHKGGGGSRPSWPLVLIPF